MAKVLAKLPHDNIKLTLLCNTKAKMAPHGLYS